MENAKTWSSVKRYAYHPGADDKNYSLGGRLVSLYFLKCKLLLSIFTILSIGFLVPFEAEADGGKSMLEGGIKVTTGVIYTDDSDCNSGGTNRIYRKWAPFEDPEHTKACDDFQKTEQTTVFMYGNEFEAEHQYKIAYYDGKDHLVKIDSGLLALADADGVLKNSFCHFPDYPNAAPGTWHAVVFYTSDTDVPGLYSEAASSNDRIACNRFHVKEKAIPELSSVLGVIGIGGFCGMTYIIMKRKRSLCV